jgi:probable rRNA maturation factor
MGEAPMPRGNAARALTEFSLVLIGDRRMSDLHAQFMGIAGPTDVLTFPLDQDARGWVTAGEVYVCVPEATRQARARKIPLRLELLLYGLHGMLHLGGYDDRTARDFALMHRTEDAILSGLGFGPVFAVPAAARTPAGPRRRAAAAAGDRGRGRHDSRARGRGGRRP